MSGIFKGDSIYKSGGGGGGYKDGGALVDSDFIKVENNTVSTYTNETRNEINYYFEVKTGEILNAVIELTNNVNATVHVYIFQNGLYFPIGNIGGNTVNSGEEYNINIVGNSFIVDKVTPGSNDPEFADIGGYNYPVVKYNNLLWTCENFMGAYGTYKTNETNYYLADSVKNLNINGWRLPTYDEVTALSATLNPSSAYKMKSASGWYSGGNGSNESKLNFKPYGYYSNPNGSRVDYEKIAMFICTYGPDAYGKNSLSYTDNSNINFNWSYYSGDNYRIPVRLVKEV